MLRNSFRILLVASQAFWLTGCLHDETPNQMAPVSATPYTQTGRAAVALQYQDEGRTSGPSEGSSMQPLYGPNAYLVIAPIDFDELESGMIVAYYDLGGRKVVHALNEKEGNYWNVQGLNNSFEDPDYVTEKNLIGVVYGSFLASR